MFHRVLACITLCIFANYTSLPQLLGQKGKPSHHTKGGFKNNYLPKEQMSKSLGTVFKWRFTRDSQKAIKFDTLSPDLIFLKNNRTEETLTWIGHSTFLWQYRGVNVLTDPHLTSRASPVSFAGPKRMVPPAISIDDFPPIDVVVISHNHYDHLDKKTILGLVKKQKATPAAFSGATGYEIMV